MPQPLRLTRRRLVGTIAGAGAAAAAGWFPRPAIAQAVKVRYTLSWLPTGQYAYIYAARQLGYFSKRGIDLDISRGYGSMAAIQAVATGQFEMGGAQTGARFLNTAICSRSAAILSFSRDDLARATSPSWRSAVSSAAM